MREVRPLRRALAGHPRKRAAALWLAGFRALDWAARRVVGESRGEFRGFSTFP